MAAAESPSSASASAGAEPSPVLGSFISGTGRSLMIVGSAGATMWMSGPSSEPPSPPPPPGDFDSTASATSHSAELPYLSVSTIR